MVFWEKVGNSADIGEIDRILFRDSNDYGDSNIRVSERWWVWNINSPQKYVGKLEKENLLAEIGIVVNPMDLLDRMRTGKYNFKYPDYE